ncbi:MAG TPA: hypothetical protein VF092_22720 [Longimicrobium sp.]
MNRTGRILAVTAGLIVGGAVFGGLAALAALLIAFALTEGMPIDVPTDVYEMVFGVGALFGGVLFPVTCWVLLRRVALGLALLGTVVGTIAGGTVGWLLPAHDIDQVYNSVIGAVIGFLIATVLLRVLASRAAPRDETRVSVG